MHLLSRNKSLSFPNAIIKNRNAIAWRLCQTNVNNDVNVTNETKRDVKTGILMLNMGGPDSPQEVLPFLTRLFTDKDIITLPAQSKLGPLIAKRRSPQIIKKYAEIGGASPIRKWTELQGSLMVDLLDKISPKTAPHKYYVGFRYANPLTDDAISEMEKDGIKRAVAFSQYAQYSCSTSGSSLNALAKYHIQKYGFSRPTIQWSFIDRWSMNRGLIDAFVDMIRKEMIQFQNQKQNEIVILFSAHALPMSAVNRGDTYPSEVGASVLKVMESLEWKYPYRLVWQSKVGPVAWLMPQIGDAIRGFVSHGHKNFLIVPISFVNEHIETLHELDIEYAKELGDEVNIRRCPAPNDHPKFINGIAHIVKDHLESDEICSKQLMMRCPLCVKAVCFQTRKWLTALHSQGTQ